MEQIIILLGYNLIFAFINENELRPSTYFQSHKEKDEDMLIFKNFLTKKKRCVLTIKQTNL
jgi:hypothetical protein